MFVRGGLRQGEGVGRRVEETVREACEVMGRDGRYVIGGALPEKWQLFYLVAVEQVTLSKI